MVTVVTGFFELKHSGGSSSPMSTTYAGAEFPMETSHTFPVPIECVNITHPMYI